jgi:transcriptional regulator with XRE-family HTH domain
MPKASHFFQAPPFEVERALITLGSNLRTARLRRNLTLEQVAEKLGVGRHVLADAERGKPSTSVGIYVGLLWVYGLTNHLTAVADAEEDEVGRLLAQNRERSRARTPKEDLDNDF